MEASSLVNSASRRLLPLSALSDERLARLVRRGDDEAFAALYHRYGQPLYRLCRSIVRDDAEAQDALQSTFTSALRALRSQERELVLRPWLYRIARNESINVLRRRRPVQQLPEQMPDRQPSLEEHAAQRERLGRVIGYLDELPERQRSALVMRELSGLSHEEIGVALATSSKTAKQAIFEARRSLHELEAGQETPCPEICRLVSDGDRRVLRSRRVRSHLRACQECATFAASLATRGQELPALLPVLPAGAAAAVLDRVLHSAREGTGAGTTAAGAGSTAAGGSSSTAGGTSTTGGGSAAGGSSTAGTGTVGGSTASGGGTASGSTAAGSGSASTALGAGAGKASLGLAILKPAGVALLASAAVGTAVVVNHHSNRHSPLRLDGAKLHGSGTKESARKLLAALSGGPAFAPVYVTDTQLTSGQPAGSAEGRSRHTGAGSGSAGRGGSGSAGRAGSGSASRASARRAGAHGRHLAPHRTNGAAHTGRSTHAQNTSGASSGTGETVTWTPPGQSTAAAHRRGQGTGPPTHAPRPNPRPEVGAPRPDPSPAANRSDHPTPPPPPPPPLPRCWIAGPGPSRGDRGRMRPWSRASTNCWPRRDFAPGAERAHRG